MRKSGRIRKSNYSSGGGSSNVLLLGSDCTMLDGLKHTLPRIPLINKVVHCRTLKEARQARPKPHFILVSQVWVVRESNGGLPRLRRSLPGAKFVLMTSHCGPDGMCSGSAFGADACLPSTVRPPQMKACLERLLHAQPFMHCETLGCKPARCLEKVSAPTDLVEQLSPREKEVLVQICSGYSNKESANAMGLSVRTVESHRAHLMAKLGAHSTAGLVNVCRCVRENPTPDLPFPLPLLPRREP